MRGTARLLALTWALACGLLLWSAADATARTEVSRNGRTITITVPVLMALPGYYHKASGKLVNGPGEPLRFLDPVSGAEVESDAFAQSWTSLAQSASAIWNQAFERLHYRCYRLKLAVTADIGTLVGYWNPDLESPVDFETLPEYIATLEPGHLVQYCGRDDYCSYEGRFGFPDPNFVFDPTGKPTEDTTAPYEQLHMAHFTVPMEPYELAHELGHFLGLADDVEQVEENGETVTRTRSGREGTFMSLDAEQKNIDQNLVDRIGQLVAETTDLPPCQIRAINESERIAVINKRNVRGRHVYRARVEIRAEDNARGEINGLATLTFDYQGKNKIYCGSSKDEGHETHRDVAVVGQWDGRNIKLELPRDLKYTVTTRVTGCMNSGGSFKLWGAYLSLIEAELQNHQYKDQIYSWKTTDDYQRYDIFIEDLGPME